MWFGTESLFEYTDYYTGLKSGSQMMKSHGAPTLIAKKDR